MSVHRGRGGVSVHRGRGIKAQIPCLSKVFFLEVFRLLAPGQLYVVCPAPPSGPSRGPHS